MIEVEMIKDIRKYEGKFIGPFTKRQLFCVGISLAYEIPFLLFFKIIPLEYRIIVAAVLFVPMYLCGWQKKYGMPYEIYATRLIYRLFLVPGHRKYKNENFFRKYRDQIIKEKEKDIAKGKKTVTKSRSKDPIPPELVPYK